MTKRFKFEIIFCSLLSVSHLTQDELHWPREKIIFGSILISKFVWSMLTFFLLRHRSVTAWISQGALQTSLEINDRKSRRKFDAIFAFVLHCFTWIFSLIFLVIELELVLSKWKKLTSDYEVMDIISLTGEKNMLWASDKQKNMPDHELRITLQTLPKYVKIMLHRNIKYSNRPNRVAQLIEYWATIRKVVGLIPD